MAKKMLFFKIYIKLTNIWLVIFQLSFILTKNLYSWFELIISHCSIFLSSDQHGIQSLKRSTFHLERRVNRERTLSVWWAHSEGTVSARWTDFVKRYWTVNDERMQSNKRSPNWMENARWTIYERFLNTRWSIYLECLDGYPNNVFCR